VLARSNFVEYCTLVKAGTILLRELLKIHIAAEIVSFSKRSLQTSVQLKSSRSRGKFHRQEFL